MSVFLAGPRHAKCFTCDAVVHCLWAVASNHQMALNGWTNRLQQGCDECGGLLLKLEMPDCPECARLILEEAS